MRNEDGKVRKGGKMRRGEEGEELKEKESIVYNIIVYVIMYNI